MFRNAYYDSIKQRCILSLRYIATCNVLRKTKTVSVRLMNIFNKTEAAVFSYTFIFKCLQAYFSESV